MCGVGYVYVCGRVVVVWMYWHLCCASAWCACVSGGGCGCVCMDICGVCVGGVRVFDVGWVWVSVCVRTSVL